MKLNKLKYIFSIIALVLAIGLNMQTVYAASGSASASGGGTVKVGDSVTITVKVSADETLYGIQFGVKYDPNILEYVSGTDAHEDAAGLVKVASSASSTSKSFSYKFKAKQPGTSSISIVEPIGVGDSDFQLSASGTSVKVAAPVQHSKDNSLKSLTISPGTLSPAFSPSNTKYTATVANSTKKITVSATPNHSAAKVTSVTGADNLSVGKNDIKVLVQAEDGSTATYTITVTREQGAAAPTNAASPSPTPEPSVTPTPSPTPEPELPPIEVKIDDKSMFIGNDFESSSMPESFKKETLDFNGRDISVAISNDGDLTLVYLTKENEETGEFYIYNKEADTFSAYTEIEGRGGRYIILPLEEGVTIPDNFIEASFNLDDKDIKGWKLPGLEDEDYYILYAMDGRGNKDLFSFDLQGTTFQRFSIDALNALLGGSDASEDELLSIKDDLDKTYKDLSVLQSKYSADMTSRLRIIVALAVVSLILFILLVNALLKNKFLKQDLQEIEGYVSDFDQVGSDEFDLAESLASAFDDSDLTSEFAATKEEPTYEFNDTAILMEEDLISPKAYEDGQKEVKEVKESDKNTNNQKQDNKAKDLENASLEDIFEFLNVDELDDDIDDDLI